MTDLTNASEARERLLSDPDIYQVAVHPHLPDVTGCWLCTLLDAYAEAVRSDTLADVAARLGSIDHPCHESCLGDIHADCQCAAWMRQEAAAILTALTPTPDR